MVSPKEKPILELEMNLWDSVWFELVSFLWPTLFTTYSALFLPQTVQLFKPCNYLKDLAKSLINERIKQHDDLNLKIYIKLIVNMFDFNRIK